MRIAVPNKGSLSEPTVEMLRESGYRVRRDSKELVVADPDNGVEFFYLRPRDVALYVGRGQVDAGVTGRDLLLDSGSTAGEVMGLGFGGSTFRFAAPAGRYSSLADLEGKRNRLGAALTDLGFEVHDSAGTYFLCADPRPLGYTDSTAFCAELPHRAGVAAIPMSAFTSGDPDNPADGWNHLVRFAFCKRDDTMDEAIRRLQVLRGR